MEERNFQFVGLTMAVILGALLVRTPEVMIQDFSASNVTAILLVFALLIFTENYVILVRYHQYLEVKYVPLNLFVDVVVGLLFITFVQLIINQGDQVTYPITKGMTVCAFLLGLGAVRQVYNYRMIQDLETKLLDVGIARNRLIIPMVADTLGIFICIFIILADQIPSFPLDTVSWSWIAVIGFGFYLLSEHVIKLDIQLRR